MSEETLQEKQLDEIKPGDLVWVNSLAIYRELQKKAASMQFSESLWRQSRIIGIVVEGPYLCTVEDRLTGKEVNYNAVRVYTHKQEFLVRNVIKVRSVATLENEKKLQRVAELKEEIASLLKEFNDITSALGVNR